MSTPPGATLSKSAAKKRAKKAAAAATAATVTTTLEPTLPPDDTGIQLGAGGLLDPANLPILPPADQLFDLPPGGYPVDIQYDTTYYEDTIPLQPNEVPVPLPFTFNYPATNPPNGNAHGGVGGNTWPNGNPLSGFAPTLNITHDDLVHAANELYKRMADPEYGMEDPYWSSLTPNLRAFVREAVPINSQNRASQPNQHDIHAMAQRIVRAASEGMGLDKGLRAGLLNTMNGQQPYPQRLAQEMGFHPHPDAKEEEFEDEEEFDVDEGDFPATNGEAPKKKKNKKKKKNASADPLPQDPIPEPPAAARHTPRPPVKQPPPRQPVTQTQTQPALNPPPPPVTPAPNQPAPTARAAGKKPMTNPPSNQPQRSAKAAGKEPAGTHHHHNHGTAAKSNAKGKAPANAPPAKIWTQSSAEDRENIRQYWLGLSEEDRKGLLRVEKEAVLRKMKEHHRTACGCAVCGRKKVNIEMELDQLYEQYYSELRNYAAEQRLAVTGQRPPPAGAGPFPGSVEVDTSGQVLKFDHLAPDPEDDEGSEEYDDEEYEDEEELDDDELASDEVDGVDEPDADGRTRPYPKVPRRADPPKTAPVQAAPRPPDGDDFLGFGTGLATIKGILTVADDLLKNDGSKFLDMMEQLAVARTVREEQNIRDIEETDEDFDDKEDDPITEEERMEEGKRMFQIFAARMFEQRVLQSYRERVARQREEQLLRELEDEETEKKNREERKAKESQKKKDKKRMQKEKADKEKAEREAELAKAAAEIKAKREEEERERNKKLEEERVRREAVKKAAAEEQARQAAERKKRQQEEKEREEEAARKKREKEEKARKEREAREKELREKEKRDKEERLAKEKAEKERLAKEKAEKAERDRIAKEQAAAVEKERLAKLEEDRLEKLAKEEAARKEREAAEQAKILLAQQQQRAKAEKALAAKQAADKAAAVEAEIRAVKAAAAAAAAARKPPTRAGPSQTTPPIDQSPAKAGGSRPPVSAGRPLKTPGTYYPAPLPLSYPTRMPVGPSFTAPGFRPPFATPGFSPPSGANGSSSISPNPPTRGFQPEPSPPFDLPRTAPIGMGYPPQSTKRIPSLDDAFSPPSAPIGIAQGRGVSAGDINQLSGLSLEDPTYRRESAIGAPPVPVSASTSAGSIGRPQYDAGFPGRSASPPSKGRILGSAALLSTDDEIIQPPTRRSVNGWDNIGNGIVPSGGAAPPGLGQTSRWSTAPSIWSNTNDSAGASGTPWGMPSIAERGIPLPPGISQPVGLPQAPQQRNPSFGNLGAGNFGGAFGTGLFSPPSQGSTGQHHH